jgi:hypothetical protein
MCRKKRRDKNKNGFCAFPDLPGQIFSGILNGGGLDGARIHSSESAFMMLYENLFWRSAVKRQLCIKA